MRLFDKQTHHIYDLLQDDAKGDLERLGLVLHRPLVRVVLAVSEQMVQDSPLPLTRQACCQRRIGKSSTVRRSSVNFFIFI
ncbi:hypothetical protein ElyMa_006466300 [Elysia marginata]|uniref:Uncharacterized protein n=1 Tax=Elysia marginata TaxID=1093978 RepID=A0AAV4HYG8_9GAST|nr:hypothetical protein ElyMa_006466300 [Elysia marginata]